jgi:hypothetical protein
MGNHFPNTIFGLKYQFWLLHRPGVAVDLLVLGLDDPKLSVIPTKELPDLLITYRLISLWTSSVLPHLIYALRDAP